MSNIIKDMVDKVVGMTPAPAVAKGLSGGSGNAVSGIDTAMAAHADKLHPVAPKGNINPKTGRAVSAFDE